MSRAEARDTRSVIRTDIRSDPPTPVRKPVRFGSVLCLPVWSFDGPSRQDGVSVGSRCEPLLACHSIRFSRFRLQRIPCISCGFARCAPPNSRWRQGNILRTFCTRVNGLVELSQTSFPADPVQDLGQQKRLPQPSEGVRAE